MKIKIRRNNCRNIGNSSLRKKPFLIGRRRIKCNNRQKLIPILNFGTSGYYMLVVLMKGAGHDRVNKYALIVLLHKFHKNLTEKRMI